MAFNIDILNKHLLTSEPLITGMRYMSNNKRKFMPSEVFNFLSESDATNINVINDSSYSSGDE